VSVVIVTVCRQRVCVSSVTGSSLINKLGNHDANIAVLGRDIRRKLVLCNRRVSVVTERRSQYGGTASYFLFDRWAGLGCLETFAVRKSGQKCCNTKLFTAHTSDTLSQTKVQGLRHYCVLYYCLFWDHVSC
jgi:hypothetical protein